MLRLRRMLSFFEALYCLGISPSALPMSSPVSAIAHYQSNENDGRIYRLACDELKLPEDGHRTDSNTYIWYLTELQAAVISSMADNVPIHGYPSWHGMRKCREEIRPCDVSDTQYLTEHPIDGNKEPRLWKMTISIMQTYQEGYHSYTGVSMLPIKSINSNMDKALCRLLDDCYRAERARLGLRAVQRLLAPAQTPNRLQAEHDWEAAKAAEREAWIAARVARLEAEQIARNAVKEEEEDRRLAAELEARKCARLAAAALLTEKEGIPGGPDA